MPGVIPSQVQGFAFPLLRLHEIPRSPLRQAVKVPLNVSTTLRCIGHSLQFCISCELAKDALCPINQVINEDVKEHWTQY